MDLIEIILTIKQMINNPLIMILKCLWIVISFQEEKWIKNMKKVAEEDRNQRMPNDFIQGLALTVDEIFR